MNALARRIHHLRRRHPVRIGAMGISCPGAVDRGRARLIYSSILGWRDIDLGCLTTFKDCPAFIDHDTRLGALAEIWNRNGKFPPNLAYLLVKEGLGVGFVIGGQVYRGMRQHGSEFGHVTLDPRGPRCLCGRRGCWETYVSEQAILDRYSRGVNGTACSGLAELVERALNGDSAAQKALMTTGSYLARGIAALSWALNVDQIIIGGELTRAWAMLEPAIRKGLDRNPLPGHVEQLPITVSRFAATGPLRGAIALALGRYIPGLPQLGFGANGSHRASFATGNRSSTFLGSSPRSRFPATARFTRRFGAPDDYLASPVVTFPQVLDPDADSMQKGRDAP